MVPNPRAHCLLGNLESLVSPRKEALEFGVFCPYWTPMMVSIYLTYPYQLVGRLRKLTAARRLYADRTLIRDVIVMLKLRYHNKSKKEGKDRE